MKTRHVVALVIGCLLLVPGVGLLLGGGAVGVMSLAARDDGGWFSVQLDELRSPGVAVTADEILVELEAPQAVTDWLDLQARLEVRSADGGPVFAGVARAGALEDYLAGARHSRVTRVGSSGVVSYEQVAATSGTGGAASVAAPAEQGFWDESVSGPGEQVLTWTASSGTWAVAVLNADGTAPVAASATAGVRIGAIGPIALALIGIGLVLLALGTLLVVTALHRGHQPPPASAAPHDPQALVAPDPHDPVRLEARLDPELSRGLWLVKWFLAIPHYLVLAVLWVAFGVVTVCAWFAILFTGRYPRALFDFNVGVLRWTWRVGYYAASGGLGTDRYPPFTLRALPDDAARLEIAYPERLSRGLIFVKWLLLLPHWIVVALIAGSTTSWRDAGWTVGSAEAVQVDLHWPGILGVLALVVGLTLLFTGSYPRGLFDLVIGLNRWVYRVIAYGALLTDVYPPFRLDQGGAPAPPPPPAAPPSSPTAERLTV